MAQTSPHSLEGGGVPKGQALTRPVRPGYAAAALLGALAFCAGIPWITYVAGQPHPASGYLQYGPLCLLALACWAIAPLGRRFSGSAVPITQAALLFYALTVSLSGFSTEFTVLQIPPNVTAARYFATPENHFERDVLPLLPDTLVIKSESAARSFYEGAASGRTPWNLWIGPLARWGALAFLYLVTSVCLLGIFRSRWIHEERLPFPLAEIPLFVAGRGSFGMAHDDRGLRRRLLLIGILTPIIFHSYNSMKVFITGIPRIPMEFNFQSICISRPWDALAGGYWTRVVLRFSLISIAYLMPSAMALGIFGFYLLAMGIIVMSRFLGDPRLGPLHFDSYTSALQHQMGAYVGLFLFSFWAARHDLRRMVIELAAGFTGQPVAHGNRDRWMLVGFVTGMVGICWWGASAGASVAVVLPFMVAALAMTFGFSLITAQSGLPILQVNNIPQEALIAFAPPRSIGLRSLSLVGIFDRLFSWYKQTSSMPSAMQALKITDSEGIPDRTWIPALFVGGLILIALNSGVLTNLAYSRSIFLASTAYYHVESMNMPHYPIRWAQNMLALPDFVPQWHWMTLGAVSMWVVQGLYRSFAWWPVHPLGMLLPIGYQITGQWFSVMVGWIIGRSITKYAGPKTYVQTRPLFLGFVLGDAAAAGIWLIVGLLTHTRGIAVPTIW